MGDDLCWLLISIMDVRKEFLLVKLTLLTVCGLDSIF